jgi:hypothetical protein
MSGRHTCGRSPCMGACSHCIMLSLAYVAGLFDGEGCIYIGALAIGRDRKTPQYFLNVLISNTFLPVLKKVRSQFGGSIHQQREGIYQWVASGRLALPFLRALLPHLQIKRKQAEIGIAFCAHLQDPSYHHGGRPTTLENLQLRESLRHALQAERKIRYNEGGRAKED